MIYQDAEKAREDAKKVRAEEGARLKPQRSLLGLKPIGRSQLHIDAIGCGRIVIIDAWTIVEDVVGCKGKLPYTVERKRSA